MKVRRGMLVLVAVLMALSVATAVHADPGGATTQSCNNIIWCNG